MESVKQPVSIKINFRVINILFMGYVANKLQYIKLTFKHNHQTRENP